MTGAETSGRLGIRMLPGRIQGKIPDTILDRAGMYALAREALALRMYRPSSEDEDPLPTLFDFEAVKGADKKARRVRWEMRLCSFQVPEISVSGQLTPQPWFDLYDQVIIEKEMKRITDEQPQARWELVLGLIDQHDVAMTVVRRGEGRSSGFLDAINKASGTWPEGNLAQGQTRIGQAAVVSQAKNIVMRTRLVFVDVSRSDLTDPNARNPDGMRRNPMSEYVESGRLYQHMLLSHRQEREIAAELVKEIAEVAELEPKPPLRMIEQIPGADVRAFLVSMTPDAVAKLLKCTVDELVAKSKEA